MKNIVIGIVAIIIILGGVYFFATGNSTNLPATSETPNESVSSDAPMTFFVASENPGNGANLGGLAGADSHCQALAASAGAGDKVWYAYLSASATENDEAVNARDRIGSGPWHNANGVLIAGNAQELHSSANAISKETALDENGNTVNGRGDSPNVHDILTGSNPDGTVAVGEADTTCSNWTSESADGSAIVGHHDRLGLDDTEAARSWNSSHGSRGCSLPNLNSTGGGGLIYCFAVSE